MLEVHVSDMATLSKCLFSGMHGYKDILLKSKFYRVGISLHCSVKVSVWVYAKKFILSKEVLMLNSKYI